MSLLFSIHDFDHKLYAGVRICVFGCIGCVVIVYDFFKCFDSDLKFGKTVSFFVSFWSIGL
jgi:hypothetical protein